ncbi:MAG: hypothetical protein IIC04_06720 [Proteobacteria bacterium]|nr:hypothetical protein [Pseudomonadota bacterium]
MKGWRLSGVGIATLIFYLPTAGMAFECPKHIATAEFAVKSAIERVLMHNTVKQVAMIEANVLTAQSLLSNARIMLRAAKSHHVNPLGPSDHARAIAKAHASHGYAKAADLLVRVNL